MASGIADVVSQKEVVKLCCLIHDDHEISKEISTVHSWFLNESFYNVLFVYILYLVNIV